MEGLETVYKGKSITNQIFKMAKNQKKQYEMMKNFVSNENKLKFLCEITRILNEIIFVNDFDDLTPEEKLKTVMDIAHYYEQHFQDKIIELEESDKHI